VNRTRRAVVMGMREQRRRPLLALLIVALPFFFITRAIASTEAIPRAIGLPGGASTITTMRSIHGANMAAITVAFLGGVLGIFVMRREAIDVDRRLVIAGFRPREAFISRLVVLGSGVALAVAASLAVTALNFSPADWPRFIVGTVFVAVTYTFVGALLGLALGPLAATYALLFLAMLDIGIVRNPMFGSGTPPVWAAALPGYGPGRLIIGAAFPGGTAAPVDIATALAWMAVLTAALTFLAWRRLAPTRGLGGV